MVTSDACLSMLSRESAHQSGHGLTGVSETLSTRSPERPPPSPTSITPMPSVYVPVVGIVKENLLNPVSPKRAVRDRENVQNTVSARRDGETIVTKAKSFISGFAGASGAFRFVDSLVRKFQSKDTTSPA